MRNWGSICFRSNFLVPAQYLLPKLKEISISRMGKCSFPWHAKDQDIQFQAPKTKEQRWSDKELKLLISLSLSACHNQFLFHLIVEKEEWYKPLSVAWGASSTLTVSYEVPLKGSEGRWQESAANIKKKKSIVHKINSPCQRGTSFIYMCK